MHLVGRQLGRYHIEAVLGRGGMGTVYRARDVMLQRLVALKVLHPSLTWNEKALQRFLLEAQTAARLRHPNIVTVYEVGQQDGLYFIVMELLNGEPLSTVLSRGRLPVPRMLHILRQVAAALDYAHQQGVIHRDVKPANVFVGPGDRVKLLDFGIAKVAEVSGLTVSGGIVGSPTYMAPEQARSEPVGSSADIYALGVLAYEMLAGRPPFAGSTAQVLHAHAYATPDPARTWNPQIPVAAERVLSRALAKQPRQRYTTASAFVRALEQTLGRQPRVPRSGKSPWMWAGVTLGVLVVLFATGALVMIVPCPFCPPSPSPTSLTPTVIVDYPPGIESVLKGTATVAVREGPGGGYPILAKYVPGTRVRVLGRNGAGTWFVVRGPGGVEGWVFAGYVSTKGIDIGDLPVYPSRSPTSTPTPTPTPTLTPAPKPDLLITRVSIGLQWTRTRCIPPSAPTTLGAWVSVVNVGKRRAGPFDVEVNGVRKTVGGGLGPGEDVTLWVPGPGGGDTRAMVDPDNSVDECDEMNNVYVGFVPIPTLPPTCTPTAAIVPTRPREPSPAPTRPSSAPPLTPAPAPTPASVWAPTPSVTPTPSSVATAVVP